MIRAHHQRTIDRLVERFADDPRYLAVIIAGSVMAGRACDASDVDIFLVATDEEYERCQAAKNYFYYTEELSDYPGGYVDGKVVDLAFLRDTAAFGSEPLRAAFQGAQIVCSRLPELAEILPRISVYPEQDQREKIVAFYSQVVLLCDYITPAYEARNGAYVIAQAAANMVHYGGRLLLAHNKILYPGLKWFTSVLAAAPDKPTHILQLADNLLRWSSQENAQAFRDALLAHHDWDITFPQAVSRFIEDVEWHWRRGNPYVYNW